MFFNWLLDLKKIFLSVFLIAISFLPLFSQNFSSEKSPLIFTMGPTICINTEDSTKSAPSPICFSFGIGLKIKLSNFYSFVPRASFFKNYFLWDGKNALPAEVENRTATVFSSLIDLPIVYNLSAKNSKFELGGGLAFLARYGILSNGVKSSDTGTSGNASSDVKEINSWLWKDMHFIYPQLMATWNFDINSKLAAGFESHIYIPTSLFTGDGLNRMIIAVSTRIMFKR